MFTYDIKFSRYALREYERKLALMELSALLPSLKSKWTVGEQGVHIQTRTHINESKLRQLVFFSSFFCANSHSREASILTDQAVVENYSNGCNLPIFSQQPPVARGRREIRYLSHSLHEYKGRFYPQIVGSLLNCAKISQGDTVLDPFSGSGTALAESCLRGINAVGLDINPLAVLIAKAKIGSLCMGKETAIKTSQRFDKLYDVGLEWKQVDISNPKIQTDADYLARWFPRENLMKILFLSEKIFAIRSDGPRFLCQSVLSNLLRDFSYQAPTDLRIRRRKDEPPSDLIDRFKKNLNRQVENIRSFQQSYPGKNLVNECDIAIFNEDSRSLAKVAEIKPRSVDIVITSPPYATALPYIDTDRLSLILFGYENSSTIRTLESTLIGNREISNAERERTNSKLVEIFDCPDMPCEIISLIKTVYFRNKESDAGFRRLNLAALLYKYFLDMEKVLQQIHIVLKRGRKAYMVVGQNTTTAGGIRISIPTDDYIVLLAEKNGFELVEKIEMAVQKSYAIYSKNAINKESILILKRR